MSNFIGIDLAWQSDKNHSGVALLKGNDRGVALAEISTGLQTLSDIQDFVMRNTTDSTVVAVDAPLVIKNVHGQRPCEKEIGKRFGKADASAHSSNLTLYPNPGSVKLAENLKSQGFLHCPEPHRRKHAGNWFFEVYPHPAHVVLFSRIKIIKYKKGNVNDRRLGLSQFRDSISKYLSSLIPPLVCNSALDSFLATSLDDLQGRRLKSYEDILDALFCAYLAAYFWTWGYDRNEMIGNIESGYIINPKPLIDSPVAA